MISLVQGLFCCLYRDAFADSFLSSHSIIILRTIADELYPLDLQKDINLSFVSLSIRI